MARWLLVAPPVALIALTACASSTSLPAFERFDPRVTPTANQHPDAAGIVLLDRGLLTFGIDPERQVPYARLRRYRRVKVLRPEGRTLANIELAHDPQAIVRGLIARSVLPDGSTRSIDPDAIRTTRSDDGRRTQRFAVPGVEVGTIIEYTYDVYTDDLRFLPPWIFQDVLPTVRSEYAVVVPAEFEVDLRFSSGGRFINRPPERFDIDGAARYSWSLGNLRPQFIERGMPGLALLAPRAHVLFRSARFGDRVHAGFGSWDDVAAWHLARQPNWATLAASTTAEAQRVAGDSPQDERALKLLEVIARDLGDERDAAAPLWRASFEHPDAVLRAKAGNPTSRGMLLVALLKAVGIPAVPGLFAYRDRDILIPDAPTVRAVDGIVAVVPRPNRPLVLDPNQLTVSSAVASPRLQNTRVVLLRSDGAEVIRVPRSSPSASKCEVDFNVRLDPRGDVTGAVEARLTGAEAGALRQRLRDAEPESLAQEISTFLHTRGVALPIDSVSVADLNALRRPLTFKGRITVPQAITGEGTEMFARIGRIIGWPTEPIRQTRRSPLPLGPPRTVEIRGTLRLPEGYEPAIIPPPASHDFDGISVRFEARTETRTRFGFVRQETWSRPAVAPRRYRAYHQFLTEVRRSEDSAFSVRRPPERPLEY